MTTHTCPNCTTAGHRVLYYGLPMFFCGNGRCATLFGFWAWVVEWVPNNTDDDGEPVFAFMAYTGSYWSALWHWLTRPAGDWR